jgi:YD repeat-containing protein
MSAPHVPPRLQQFVDDEMLRASLLFDQVVQGGQDRLRKSLPALGPMQRAVAVGLLQTLPVQRQRVAEHFLRSLREQVQEDLAWHQPRRQAAASKPLALALVDEDTVALDVELSHAIELIKNHCEHELRDLQTFTSALVGDMDVSRDHNPFRAETYARALGAAVQALPLSTAHHVALMRHVGPALAPLLRKAYAGASARLESQGIEPAAYRTVILPSGVRSAGRFGETTFSPDLHRMRDSMPAPLDLLPPRHAPHAAPTRHALDPATAPDRAGGRTASGGPARPAAVGRQHWSEVAGHGTSRADRQAVELVSRLFDAMLADPRVPDDAGQVIARLHNPALRTTLRDASLLDQDKHPLWRFINRLVFEAQMTPDSHDPDRAQLLKLAHNTAEQLAAETEPDARLYRWACDRLDSFLHKRFTRRLSAASSHIGALQKLEDKLTAGQTTPSTLHGMLDVPQLDTVPAELMEEAAPVPGSRADAEAWLDSLVPGDWVRLFLQGRWVHAALLWPGDRREVWLFGDGGSDATWAVRRGALLMMHGTRLAKKLKQRSIVGSAAARVHEQVTATHAA